MIRDGLNFRLINYAAERSPLERRGVIIRRGYLGQGENAASGAAIYGRVTTRAAI